jgi:hypothetical protein
MLVLTSATRAAIQSLTERAHTQPYTPVHTRRLFYSPLPERSLTVPHGHRVTLTVGQFQPGWLCRRLEVAGPDAWPAVQDVCHLMTMSRFNSSLEQCLTWYAGPPTRRTVNILEPVNGDWSPLRSS